MRENTPSFHINMMDEITKFFLFGSKPHHLVPELSKLLQKSQDPFLNSFWERAYRSLRSEVGALPQVRIEELPRFSCVADLCALYSQEKLHASLCHALVCIHQLAAFIRQVLKSKTCSTFTIMLGFASEF